MIDPIAKRSHNFSFFTLIFDINSLGQALPILLKNKTNPIKPNFPEVFGGKTLILAQKSIVPNYKKYAKRSQFAL